MTATLYAATNRERPHDGMDAGSAEDYWKKRNLENVTRSGARANELFEGARAALAASRDQANALARAALTAAGQTYWFAEQTDRATVEHAHLHDIVRWTRETFGCKLDYDGTHYSTSCPVKLADKRLGFSIGYVAKKWCSICDEDLSECPHRRDRLYWVAGEVTTFGSCRVCGSGECDPSPSEFYPAPVIAVIRSFDVFEEVSLVDVPAQPLARLVSIPISTTDLQTALGPSFVPGMAVSCDHCLEQYHGLPKPLNIGSKGGSANA